MQASNCRVRAEGARKEKNNNKKGFSRTKFKVFFFMFRQKVLGQLRVGNRIDYIYAKAQRGLLSIINIQAGRSIHTRTLQVDEDQQQRHVGYALHLSVFLHVCY